MRESDIVYDTPHGYWISRDKNRYAVWCSGVTHSVLDSAYAKTDDGLSIAKARAQYLERTHIKGTR